MSQPQSSSLTPAQEAMLDAVALQRLRDLDPRGDSRLLDRVLDTFRNSLTRSEPQLREAGISMDLPLLRYLAHTLKSSSASVGALALSQRCAEVELLARDGKGDHIGAPLDALLDELGRVAAVLALPASRS